MNTNHLKRFAQEARRKLLAQVEAKLSFVLSTDSAELREKLSAVKQLREELERTTKPLLIEKVAYTWFNRLMALRFMDANDYQPLGIRVITPKDGYTIPELLDEAKRGNIPDELKVNRQKIYDLLDGKIPSNNPQNEAYKELLIAACNHLHTTFPFLFEKINDYTELLLPDDLTSDFSILKDVRESMPMEDCKNVEIIGWLYQFYISEKKDEVIGSKQKVKKEDIPAATQLFTPRWIVEYMVQNTLGKLWLQNRPKSRLRQHMPYFIESASLEAEEYLKIQSPEEIKLLDPASGSGHILVYAFDLFTKIYEEEGYNTSEIPQLIIQNNLFGFEIDERAAQLSAIALMMKAREYQRRVFRKEIKPNILCFQDLHVSKDEIKELAKSTQIQVSSELMHDLLLMQQATNLGSLILPHAHTSEIETVLDKFIQFLPNADVFQRSNVEYIIASLKQLFLLGWKFHCVVANPPYMGGGNMNNALSEFVKNYYPKSKADLFSCFIERSLKLVPVLGFNGLVTMESWMFLSSFEDFRKVLLKNSVIHSLTHFGWHVMRIAFGTVSFILQNRPHKNSFLGTYSYLEFKDIDKNTDRPKVFPVKDNGRFKITNQKDFEKIPSSIIGYWLSKNYLNTFQNFKKLSDFYYSDGPCKSGNDAKYLRLIWEVNSCQIGENKNWRICSKGGSARKYFGNIEYCLKWDSNSQIHYKVDKISRITPVKSRDLDGITWTLITSGFPTFRYLNKGYLFNSVSPCVFSKSKSDEIHYKFLHLLNSKVSKSYFDLLNPTLALNVKDVLLLPIPDGFWNMNVKKTHIENFVFEWNTKETAWDFQLNELLRHNSHEVVDAFDSLKQYWSLRFKDLHQNEELFNQSLIEIYGLQHDLTPETLLEVTTILQDELDRKALAKLNKKLKRDPETHLVTNYDEIELPFIASEIMAQFISYLVGCMLGRYSLDKEGLVLANQGETLEDYLHKIEKKENECTFLPDDDNIIPILDDEWFEDDIVGRFYKFLKVTFGESNFNKNLAFIEEQIGKDIRKYFIRDFYADHIKRYKKRPIYWLFSSPKGSFNALIYMHRYTPDTVSNILNKYLKEFMGKLKTRKEHLQHVQVTGSAADINKAIKEIDGIDKTLMELQEYERDILYPLATERIAIDLDDGVLVNYNKFGKAVKEVDGLNDKKTKDKVRGFDWIDGTLIR